MAKYGKPNKDVETMYISKQLLVEGVKGYLVAVEYDGQAERDLDLCSYEDLVKSMGSSEEANQLASELPWFILRHVSYQPYRDGIQNFYTQRIINDDKGSKKRGLSGSSSNAGVKLPSAEESRSHQIDMMVDHLIVDMSSGIHYQGQELMIKDKPGLKLALSQHDNLYPLISSFSSTDRYYLAQKKLD